MSAAPAHCGHRLNLYRQYFQLVAAGTKTIEVRVNHPHLENLAAGDRIEFRINDSDERCEVEVLPVTEYPTFEALLDGEGPENVNHPASRQQQLESIRSIYSPEKEPLSVLAIEAERYGWTAPGTLGGIASAHGSNSTTFEGKGRANPFLSRRS
ncbi:ASCH domain-containing protein [Streptomyces sp. NPDC054958]